MKYNILDKIKDYKVSEVEEKIKFSSRRYY